MNDNDFFTTFIFPFKYENNEGKVTPAEAARLICGSNNDKKQGWCIEPHAIERDLDYNEYYYFYYYVREALYSRPNKGLKFLTREDFKKYKVTYYITKDETETISLDIKSIDLHLFDNQIGILTITTEKEETDTTTTFEKFLRYNDVARRVYPPYLAASNEFGPEYNTAPAKRGAKILPDRVALYKSDNDKKPLEARFEHIQLDEKSKKLFYLSEIIEQLLAPFHLREDSGRKKREIYFTPFTDDRMFVVSYFADKELSAKLTEKRKKTAKDGEENEELLPYPYENSDEWYRFLFVDGGSPGLANDSMKTELIKKHTYDRWVDYGNLIGMCRYSLVLLCSLDKKSEKNKDPFYIKLKNDMKSMYYQMALAVLFQRAMLIKFSEDIEKTTALFDVGMLNNEIKNKADQLQGDFIKFINKYWFTELTPQEQGIEMYNQWLGLLSLDKLYNQIEKEISALSEYIENKLQAERNALMFMITRLGLPLATITLILSVWMIYEDRINLCAGYNWLQLCRKALLTVSFKYLWQVLVVSLLVVCSYIFRKDIIYYSKKCIAFLKSKWNRDDR